jgi:hypothetical protein
MCYWGCMMRGAAANRSCFAGLLLRRQNRYWQSRHWRMPWRYIFLSSFPNCALKPSFTRENSSIQSQTTWGVSLFDKFWPASPGTTALSSSNPLFTTSRRSCSDRICAAFFRQSVLRAPFRGNLLRDPRGLPHMTCLYVVGNLPVTSS